MKQKGNNLFLALAMAVIMLVCIAAYSFYTRQQIYHESTQGLLSTYGQVTKTFTMFAQRNWNILSDWANYLKYIADDANAEEKWMDFISEKATWQYSDFYLFNAEIVSIGPRPADRALQNICRTPLWNCTIQMNR